MGYANSRYRLAQNRCQRHKRRTGRIGLVHLLVDCQMADAVGGMHAAAHRLVLRQRAIADCQFLWHARGQRYQPARSERAMLSGCAPHGLAWPAAAGRLT